MRTPTQKSGRNVTPALIAASVLFTAFFGTMAVNAATERRDVDDFSAIAYALPFSVEFVVSDEPYVMLEGDADTIDEIITEVRGDTLRVRKEDSWFDWSDEEVIVTIGYTEVERIAMAGSGDGFAKSLEADELEIVISGSANLNADSVIVDELDIVVSGAGDVEIGNVEADEISSQIAGSGSIDLTGRSVSQEISIAGSGDLRAADLRTQETIAKVAGSGDVEVWSEAQLTATVMGSGDIEYYGNPSVNERVMGSGEITRVGDSP